MTKKKSVQKRTKTKSTKRNPSKSKIKKTSKKSNSSISKTKKRVVAKKTSKKKVVKKKLTKKKVTKNISPKKLKKPSKNIAKKHKTEMKAPPKNSSLSALKAAIQASVSGKKDQTPKQGKTKEGVQQKTEKLAATTQTPQKETKGAFNIFSIKSQIQATLEGKKRDPAEEKKRKSGDFIFTGIEGFDSLLDQGIPKGAAVLVAGGAGSGKTLFSLQSLIHHANAGKKCLYMSFEESEERLISHMEGFGWEPKKLIKKKRLMIKRFNPFEITRSVDALLMKSKGELLIDVKPIVFPKGFKPDVVVVDSLTAIGSAFTGKEDSYRIYIEQLFRFFEEIGATSFLITETEQVPKVFSSTGVEEFLADAVVVIYNLKRGNVRERAIEVLKLRGAGHKKKIVAMNITGDGIEIFPDQEVFGGIDE